jgi:hypothetical protein
LVALVVGTLLTAGLTGVASAGEHNGYHGQQGPNGGWQPGAVTVVADNLNSPRQIVVHDGAVYVAEAGTGGVSPAPDVPGIGFTGSVTRVRNGHATRVQTGLLSISLPGEGGGPAEVVGVDALTFKGDQLFGIATGACDLAGAPAEAVAQAGHVLRLNGGDDVKPVADVSAYECANDPDGLGVDTDPYGIAAKGKSFYVADAAGNDILKVKHKEVSLASVIGPGQTVPTSLAFGPDGALYIGTLNFEAGPGGAKVYRLDVHSGQLSTYADGLSAVTGIAFDKRGNLYVSEFTTGFDENGPSPDGDVVVVPPGGGTEGRAVLGAGSLHFPGGVGVDRNGVYVSNWSIAPGEDGAFGPGNHGQLVRIALDRHHGGGGHGGDASDDEYDCSRDDGGAGA